MAVYKHRTKAETSVTVDGSRLDKSRMASDEWELVEAGTAPNPDASEGTFDGPAPKPKKDDKPKKDETPQE